MNAFDVSGLVILIVIAIMWFGGIVLFMWLGRKPEPTADQIKMMEWAKVFVSAAEQLYETNEEKLKYVTDELMKQAATTQTLFTEAEIRAFVEWAVYWVKRIAVPVDPVAMSRPRDN